MSHVEHKGGGVLRTGTGLRLAFIALFLLVLYLVVIPLAFILFSSFGAVEGFLPHERVLVSLENYRIAFSDPKLGDTLLNTLIFTVGSTVLGMGICIYFAWLIERTNIWGRDFFFALILIPMVIPNVIYSSAWIQLINPNNGLINGMLNVIGLELPDFAILSLGGMVLVQGMAVASHAYLLVAAAFRTVDPTWEEQSAIAGKGILETLLRIAVPILKPALFASSIFFLIVCMETFDVPGALGLSSGTHVLSTRIYWVTHPPGGQLPNYGMASCLSVLLLVTATLLIWVYERQLRHAKSFVTITGKGYRAKRIELGALRIPLFLVALVIITLMVLLPLFVLVWRSLLQFYMSPSLSALSAVTIHNYVELFNDRSFKSIVINTVMVGLCSAGGAVMLASLIAWFSLRSNMPARSRQLLRSLAFLPQAIPSIVIGFSFMIAYLFLPVPIYGTIWILILALMTKYIAFAAGTMAAAQMQLSPELEDASLIAGASWIETYARIVAPLIAPAFFNCFIWVLIHAVRELAISIMLYTPSSQILSTKLWGLWEGGMVGQVCALGVITSSLLISLLWLPALVRAVLNLTRRLFTNPENRLSTNAFNSRWGID